jgi:cystathionine beta-lyase
VDPITGLIHHPYLPPEGFAAPQPAVFKASTVIFPDVATLRARDWRSRAGYSYGLLGTPTTYTLEARIASLEAGQHCLLVPSGLAAIALVDMALLKQGDEVLIPDNAYGPSKALAQGELAHWGITHQFYDPMDPQDLVSRLSERSRLVWLEAPGSVTMDFPPLAALMAACRAHGVMTALDNTWSAGLAFNGFDLAGPPGAGGGADIVIQALTKYPSGGADVLMGSIVTRDEELHLRIKLAHVRMGLGVAANDAEAVLRGLPSISLRYRAQDQAARQLAKWLQGRPEVAQVLHPALPGAPGHENWQALCAERDLAAGLFSFVLDHRYTPTQADAFCDRLRLFKLGYSWGGPISLALPYDLGAMRSASFGHWQEAGPLVRLAIGLEAVADLQADLAQAFEALR